MIEPRPIEERISRWVEAAAPDDVPHRVLESAFGLTRTMPQESARRRIPAVDRRSLLLVAAALIALALAGALIVGSQNPRPRDRGVPFMRGDASRTAVEVGPGPVAAPVLAWDVPLSGSATQYPILLDGTVIVGAGSELVAVEARTGAVRWRVLLGGIADGAPAAAGDIVVVADGEEVQGFDLATGAQRWHVDLVSGDQRPAIVDGIAYLGTAEGRVVGLDVANGSTRWSWQGPRAVAVRSDIVAGGVAYVSTDDARLMAIRLSDGQQLWEYATQGSWLEPSVSGDTLYVSSVGGETAAPGEVAAIDRQTGRVRWTWRPHSGLQASHGAVRNGILYVATRGDGIVALADRGTMAAVIWSAPDIALADLPPVLSGEMLYVFARGSGIVGIQASNGTPRWWATSDLEGNGPLVWEGLLIGTQGQPAHLRAWAESQLVATLQIASAPPAPSVVPHGPIPANPLRVVTSFDATVTGVDTGPRRDGPEGTEVRFGPDGLLYVLDVANQLSVLDPTSGRPVRSWGGTGFDPGKFSGEHDIAIGPDGSVIVADGGNPRVQVFDRSGNVIRTFGSYGSRPGEFVDPAEIDVGPDGGIYVMDGIARTLQKFDRDGRFVWRVGGAGDPDPQLRQDPYDVAVLRDGRVLVTFDPGGPAKLLDPATGAVVGRWGPEDIGWSGEPVVAPDGRVWMFEYVPGRIDVFDPDGTRLGSIAYEGRDASFVPLYPTPVIGPNGHAYSFDATRGLVELAVSLPRN